MVTMSESSQKGKSLEDYIAKTLRKKLGARVERDKRSGAGSHQKTDIRDFYQDTRFDIEAKNHKTVAIKDWMRQAKAGSSPHRVPTVVFMADDEALACLPFDDLVDLAAEIQQLQEEIKVLRTPLVQQDRVDGLSKLIQTVDKMQQHPQCRNGHLVAPGSTKCLAKGCPYSSSYKAKKVKK